MTTSGPLVPWMVERHPGGVHVEIRALLTDEETAQLAEALTRHAAHVPGHAASQAAPRPEPSAPTLHAYHPIPGGIELLCDAPIYRPTRWTDDPDDVTCTDCRALLPAGPE